MLIFYALLVSIFFFHALLLYMLYIPCLATIVDGMVVNDKSSLFSTLLCL